MKNLKETLRASYGKMFNNRYLDLVKANNTQQSALPGFPNVYSFDFYNKVLDQKIEELSPVKVKKALKSKFELLKVANEVMESTCYAMGKAGRDYFSK